MTARTKKTRTKEQREANGKLLRELIAAAAPFAESDIWRSRDVDEIMLCKQKLTLTIRAAEAFLKKVGE